MKIKIKGLAILLILFFISGCNQAEEQMHKDINIADTLPTEQFLQKYLVKSDGRMTTNMTDRQEEYLSETLGLWMNYLLLKNDQVGFHNQVEILKEFFLAKNGLVIWEIKDGEKSSVNAFIDDLRIINTLYEAGESWHVPAYTKLAKKMSRALVRYQTKDGFLVDFVDIHNKQKASSVTLSYIMPSGLDKLKAEGYLSEASYRKIDKLLEEAPITATGFYPKKYDLEVQTYKYDDEVNMIDQFLVGYHRAKWGKDITGLLQNAKDLFQAGEGRLYGRYDIQTKEPTVPYESVATYALAILMSVEAGELDFANDLYSQMKTLQINDETSSYYGSYMDLSSKETHTFDNLLALIVERKGKNESHFTD